MRTLALLLALAAAPVAVAQTTPDTVRTGRGCVGAACLTLPYPSPADRSAPRYVSPAPWSRTARQDARLERYCASGAVLGGGLAFVATMAIAPGHNDTASLGAAVVLAFAGTVVGTIVGAVAAQ